MRPATPPLSFLHANAINLPRPRFTPFAQRNARARIRRKEEGRQGGGMTGASAFEGTDTDLIERRCRNLHGTIADKLSICARETFDFVPGRDK